MTNLTIFNFQGKSVRTQYDESGNIWFCLGDVLYMMGSTTKRSDAVTAIEDIFGKEGVINLPLETLGGIQDTLFISEGATTFLISRSRTEIGKQMNRWLHLEVLPSIRKTGCYSIAPIAQSLPCHELAVQKARAIREITDTLDDNPRLAQLLIDHSVNDLLDRQQLPSATEPQLRGVVEIAVEMGFKVDHSSRVKLGSFIAATGLFEAVKEKRLCNGVNRDINCYRDTPELREAIAQFFS